MKLSNRGFTLVEILIVLFIISIVTSVALLSINHNKNKQVESFANELAQIVTLAEQQAMLEPRVLGLFFNEDSFQFVNFDPTQKKKNMWLLRDDKLLGKYNIPNGIQVAIQVENKGASSTDENENNHPQIIISTNGDVTPFTIYVGRRGEKPQYAVIGEADGNVTNKSLS